jgi:glycosyltransferase involved in cell wall biosynthesis
LQIRRFPLPPHQSGMRDQARAFGAYARAVLSQVRDRRYDAVLATSSRLMTAALGALIARRKRLPLYLDIRDIFVDTMGDVLPPSVGRFAVIPLGLLERWTMRAAVRINLVSAGFRDYFTRRYPGVPLSFFTNGIDDEFIGLDQAAAPARPPERRVEVLYAGNIGEGQGLHLIIPALAERLPDWRFRIIGDGGRARQLRGEIQERRLANVSLEPPVKRRELAEASVQADILFLHLNDYPAFAKVLPSKIFEYGALGKPVWAGVGGFAAEFIRSELSNAAVFPPCDATAAIAALASLELKTTPRPDFVRRYARRHVTERLAADILAAFRERTPGSVRPHVRLSP